MMTWRFVLVVLGIFGTPGSSVTIQREADYATLVTPKSLRFDGPYVSGYIGHKSAQPSIQQVQLLVSAGEGTNQLINISVELDPNNMLDSAIGSNIHAMGDVVQSIWKQNQRFEGAVGGLADVTPPAGEQGNLVDADGIGDIVANIGGAIGGGVASVADSIGNIAAGVGAAVDAASQVINKFKELREPLQDGGASTREVNTFLLCSLAIAAVAILLGLSLDTSFKASITPGRPRIWLMAVLITSYGLLLPGLYQVVFSMVIAVHVLGFNFIVTAPVIDAQLDGPPGPVTESMLSVLRTLWLTGGYIAVVLVVLYAIIIPVVKLSLLLAGEFLRFSESPGKRRTARLSIQAVQVISKWACPDMFAYIHLITLLRDITEDTQFLVAKSHLDVGFACFSLFCVLSTFSSLAITPPELIAVDDLKERAPERPTEGRRTRVAVLALILATVFGVCLAFGTVRPCMGLKLNEDLLLEPKGPLPSSLRPMLQVFDLDKIAAEVTISGNIQAAWAWWRNGEAVGVLALIMLFVFVLALPILEMLALIIVALGLLFSMDKLASQAMKVATYLHHVAMLDVFTIGIIIVNLAAVTYKKQGIVTWIGPGIYFLLAAELAHYTAFYTLDWIVASYQEPQGGGKHPDVEGGGKHFA